MKKSTIYLDMTDIKEISRYAHWIPLFHGLTRKFFEKNYPGGEWNDFIPVLLQKKIIIRRGTPRNLIPLMNDLYIQKDISGIAFSRITTDDESTIEVKVFTS